MLKQLKNNKDFKAFCQISRDLYVADPLYISPLDKDVTSILGPHLNSSGQDRVCRCWMLQRGGMYLGRIAAFFERSTQFSGIGFFECIDDVEAASTLFNAAENWLQKKGFTNVQAPVNFGQRDRFWGLLINGSASPAYQENYHHTYYRGLFESCGYHKAFEQTTSLLQLDSFDTTLLDRLADRAFQIDGLKIEHLDLRKLDKYARDFVHIYNRAWGGKDFFRPLTKSDVKRLFREMKPIIQEKLIWFTYVHDEPVSFYLSVPEINPLLKAFNGRLNLWNKISLSIRLKNYHPERVRALVFGVIPEYQHRAVFAPMMSEMFENLNNSKHVKSLELSWIGDFNPSMHAFFRRMKAGEYKTHYTYEKHL